jgi:2-desacetyl-2-hydroxyethyl bacteriochlorophyllide A dehydrogenase
MNAIVLEKPGDIRNVQTEAPSTAIPEGHALVRVQRIGVCGTDCHAYRGKQPFFSYPRILGHELSVVVEKVNDPKSNLKPGDRCAVEPYLHCDKCIACRRNKPNCCLNLKVMGVHIDGGMREQIVVETRKLHRSEKLSLDELALVEPLGIGCHAVTRAQIEPGEWVLVVGAGPIGLSVIPFAQAAGGRVISMDISNKRLAFCRDKMGVQHTINAEESDVLAALKEITNQDLPTCVIDATGNAPSMARCFDLAAGAGRIVFVGLVQGELTFNDPNFHKRELTLLASRNSHPADFDRIIELVEQGKIDTKPWITHRVPFNRAVEEFPKWMQPESGVLKAIIEL